MQVLTFSSAKQSKTQKTKRLFLPASIKVGLDNNVLNSILEYLLAHGSYLAAVFKVQPLLDCSLQGEFSSELALEVKPSPGRFQSLKYLCMYLLKTHLSLH